MDDTGTPVGAVALPARIAERITELEREMDHLQLHHPGAYAIAHAWAERHDAIVAMTPQELRAEVESRLSRIGIRWGLAPGARVTQEFHALGWLRGPTPRPCGVGQHRLIKSASRLRLARR